MRSFIGSFKSLSRCIPKYASFASSLKDSIKSLDNTSLIKWTLELSSQFENAQSALRSPQILTIPKPSDHQVLTVDASPLNKGLGATLFIQLDNTRLPVYFYSFKLKEHQLNWFPCEMEALAAGVDHFAPFARESKHPMQVLTDSDPCTKAFKRLCKGQFSASARVSTFLSTLSSHNVTVSHIPGVSNVTSDYSSRHPQECCQICKFVEDTASSVVRSVTIGNVLSGNSQMRFLNKAAWQSAQQTVQTFDEHIFPTAQLHREKHATSEMQNDT